MSRSKNVRIRQASRQKQEEQSSFLPRATRPKCQVEANLICFNVAEPSSQQGNLPSFVSFLVKPLECSDEHELYNPFKFTSTAIQSRIQSEFVTSSLPLKKMQVNVDH